MSVPYEVEQLPAHIRAELEMPYLAWRRGNLRLSLALIGAAAAFVLLMVLSGKDPLDCAGQAGIAAYLALMLTGALRLRALKKMLAQHPELADFEGTLGKNPSRVRIAVCGVVVLVLLPISVVAGLMAGMAFLFSLRGERTVTLHVLMQKRGKLQVERLFVCTGMLLFFAGAFAVMASVHLHFIAQTRLGNINESTQKIWAAIEEALDEMNAEGIAWEADYTRFINANTEFAPDSLEGRVQRLCPESKPLYYAVVFDADTHRAMAVYASLSPLPDELAPPDQAEQLRLLKYSRTGEKVIGFYFTRT